ncbi:MAG: hypothetical protein ACXVCY_10570 [Pseudobdellovibrionaceae bacterium]
MTTYGKLLAHVLFITSLLITTGASANGRDTNNLSKGVAPWRIEHKAQQFLQQLKSSGYEVKRGHFKLWDLDNCEYTYEKIGMCGNNPAAPYVTFAVPPWNDEFVNPVLSNVWGPSKEGYNDVYRLDPDEAILLMGQLPPQGSFFSEQTWVFSREGSFDEHSTRYQEIANSRLSDFTRIFFKNLNDKRSLLFASLSNPNNNVVIERQSGASFGEMRYFIITPNKNMDKAVRKMLSRFAVDNKNIFTEPIPNDMKVGLSEPSDDFTTLIRYAHPDDGGKPGTPSNSWRKNPPLVVLRIRQKNSLPKPQTYPPVVLETRTAVDEHPLKQDLSSLLAAVSRRWGQPCTNADCSDRAENFIDLQNAPIYMVGHLCIPFMQNCLGDNWDASYHIHPPSPIDNDEIYVAAGVLGTKSGNAVYTSLSINQIPMIKGVWDISDKELENTAKEYSAEVNNTDKFYLYYFARNCKGLEQLTYGHCVELTMIPQGYKIAIAQRNYIKQGSQRGPDSALVLSPMMIRFKRP